MHIFTRHELESLERIDATIQMYQDEIDEIMADATGCTQHLSDMPGGGPSTRSKVEDGVIRKDKPLAKLLQLIEKRKAQKEELIELIDTIENPVDREMIFYLYVKGYTIQQTANTMNYSYDAIKSRHRNFFRKMNELRKAQKQEV